MIEEICHNRQGAPVTFRLGETRQFNTPTPYPDRDGVMYPIGTEAVIIDLGVANEPWDAERVIVQLPDGIRADCGHRA